MSLLLNQLLADATSMLQGEIPSNIWPNGFSVDGLATWRLRGLAAAPGHAELDSDLAWESVVRSWWALGLTWGLCAVGEADGVSWNLVLPDLVLGASETVGTHLTGAVLEPAGAFSSLDKRINTLPFRGAMGGHTGLGPSARLEPAIRTLLGHEFMVLVIAKALPRRSIEAERHRLSCDERYVRDEYLSRGGLEKDNHAGASRYLDLVETAKARAVSAFQEGGWLVRTLVSASDQRVFNQACSLIHGCYSADGGQPEPIRWQNASDPRALTFLRTSEAAALTRPPRRELPGFIVETHIKETNSPHGGSVPAIFATATVPAGGSRTIASGKILNDQGKPGAWLEIGVDELCRHLLVAGMTGSGKGVTCEHLLLELWREHQIPWLVIEPGMKTGYRRLLNSEIGLDLDVWAIGDPKSRRLSLNPMAVPPGVGLAEHTTALFTVFASAFELVAPMPEVLATAIEQTYRNHGWDLAGLVPHGAPPTLADLVDEIDRSASKLGYGAEITGNIRAGLLLRMRRLLEGPLAPELASPFGLDIASLVKRPTIIELSALPDAPSQALVMGLITLQLRHHWRLEGQSDSLRHAILIEEAHRLLKAVPETAANASRNQAVESLANMLAEMRGLGVGMIIVDQAPSALVPSVIANTGTKILHRLDHPADRELAGRAAGLPANQIDLLGALPVGDAILRSDRRTRPFRLRLPNPAITYGRLPLPHLPLPSVGNPMCKDSDCQVCATVNCSAQLSGANAAHLQRRLAELQSVFQESEAATWDWATREICDRPGTISSLPAGPLCFLISLGTAAGLSRGTLTRLREAFQTRAYKPKP